MAINIFLAELLNKIYKGGANFPPNQNRVKPIIPLFYKGINITINNFLLVLLVPFNINVLT